MDYDAIAAHFLLAGDDAPEPTLPSTAARTLRDSVEPIATIGWWSREAAAAVTALGHGFFDGYVWGRAASLGADTASAVVVSAFGVFEPAMLGSVYTQARTISSARDVLDARERGAESGLVAATIGVTADDVAYLGDRLLPALADLDGSGRPLFSALRALAIPETPHGRAWRAAELVREHRGDGHVIAFVAAGLHAVEVNVLTEVWLGYGVGEYSATRGFAPEQLDRAARRLSDRGWLDDLGDITDAGRAARDAIEAATDRTQDDLVEALGDDIDHVIAAAERISHAVLAHHAAPADPRKRAAG